MPQDNSGVTGEIPSRQAKDEGLKDDPAVTLTEHDENILPQSRPMTRARTLPGRAALDSDKSRSTKTLLKGKGTAHNKRSTNRVEKTPNTVRKRTPYNESSKPKPKAKRAVKGGSVKARVLETTERHQNLQDRPHTAPSPSDPAVPPSQQITDVYSYNSAQADIEAYLDREISPRWTHMHEPANFGCSPGKNRSDVSSILEYGASTPVERLDSTTLTYGTDVPAMKKPKPEDKDFVEGLIARNVEFEPQEDLHGEVDKILLENRMDLAKEDPESESRWENDLKKCKDSSFFKCTVMMEAIDRHNLKEHFGLVCDVEWSSSPPPCDEFSGIILPNPKSDLIVGFTAGLLLRPVQVAALGPLKERMFPQAYLVDNVPLAFPFLAFESKGDIRDEIAMRKTLNTASVALYNVWKFIEGIQELQQRFVKEVRFFTAVGNGEGFNVYKHWALEMESPRGQISWNSSGAESVELGFYHETLESLEGKKYTRINAVHTVQRILRYGEDVLLKFIKDAIPLALARQSDMRSEAKEKLRSASSFN